MEETYELTDACNDLMVILLRKSNKKAADEKEKPSDSTLKGIKQPDLPMFDGNASRFEDWEAVFDAFIGDSHGTEVEDVISSFNRTMRQAT